MTIHVFNTLTKKKEEFVPWEGKTVKMYSCGVTVYDQCHIGHARSLYVFDLMRRYLKSRGFQVRFVRNITDVDDKIINRAKELKKDWAEVVAENIASYYQDMQDLGIERADIEPRATENIAEMIRLIERLLKKGAAYVKNGDVYFAVRQFPAYGRLSGQGIDKMREAVRIEPDEKKEDPLDFALWKRSKEGEPSWDSPWGPGRPGWHMECSCMSLKHLACETLDIHAGGRDLIFPHHENEIAQVEAVSDKPFAKYWIHHGLLTIKGQKMSKSSGNFISLLEAIKNYGADNLKFFFLGSHYASPIDFSPERLIEAGKQKASFYEFFDKVHTWRLWDGHQPNPCLKNEMEKINALTARFAEAMDDDFNTPEALASLFELIDLGARLISANKEEGFRKVYEHVSQCFQRLGLQVKPGLNLSAAAERLIQQRGLARVNRDFALADRLRIEIRDKFRLNCVDTDGGMALTDG